MKRIPLLFIFALCAAATLCAEDHASFTGRVVRMETSNCVLGGFKAKMAARPVSATRCPEYTVVTPNAVFVVIGRHSEDFIPLAQDLDFHIVDNDLQLSQKSKSRFLIEIMMLRADWEREEQRKALMLERSVSYEQTQDGLTASAK